MVFIIFLSALPEESRDFLDSLYREYRAMMWRYALHITKSGDMADDAVQASFVSLISRAELLRTLERRSLDAYISLTVKRAALRLLGHKQEEPLPEEVRDAPMEEWIDRIVNRDAIARAMAPLSEEDASLICLRYGHDLKFTDVSAILRIQPGTARVRAHRILKVLKQNLASGEGWHGQGEGSQEAGGRPAGQGGGTGAGGGGSE